MTTDTAPLERAALRPRAGFAWQRALAAFALMLGGLLVLALAFAVGYDRMHDGRVFAGVTVHGVAVGGLEPAEAAALLRERLPDLSNGAVNVRFADVQETISFSQIGRDYDYSLMVEQALALGRSGDPLDRLRDQFGLLLQGTAIEPSLTWDSQALADAMTQAAISANRQPVDARIERENGIFVVVPAQEGRSVDAAEGLRQASAALMDPSISSVSVIVPAEPIPPAIPTAEAEAAAASAERVAAEPLTISAGNWSTVLEADSIRGWLNLVEQPGGGWSLNLERQPIDQLVAHYALEIDRPAQDASFTFEDGEAVAVPGQTGEVVDQPVSAETIHGALEQRSNGGGPPAVSLAVTVTEPEFGLEDAEELVSRVERLSRWRTNYQPGPLNFRGANIRIPTDKIDGLVLLPGETFDFWEVVGFPDEADGYGPGAAIIRGRTVPDGALAGGICSCSTTIFNAALRAGLEMGDRRNHHYYINRYPRGLDATVWLSRPGGPGQTISFTNDMDHPILIRGINRRSAVIFEVWGVPDGRTIELSRPRVDNRRPAYEVLEYRDDLRPGQTRRVEWPANGFDSWVTRTVRDAAGAVIHEETYYSRYARILGVTQIGRSEGDPPHRTRVRAGGGSLD